MKGEVAQGSVVGRVSTEVKPCGGKETEPCGEVFRRLLHLGIDDRQKLFSCALPMSFWAA